MDKNKNYMKIYCSVAMIYALGAFGGRLHAMSLWQKYLPQCMTRQQINDGVGFLKNQASAIMSKNYTIPQVYVWGGAIAFAGLACLYGRQCFSIHKHLYSRAIDDKHEKDYQDAQKSHVLSFDQCVKLYSHIAGFLPGLELLEKYRECNDVALPDRLEDNLKWVVHANNVEELRQLVIDRSQELIRLTKLLHNIVFSRAAKLRQIRCW